MAAGLSPHPFQILVYGHPMVLSALDAPGPLGPLDHDLLVEAAEQSLLAHALGVAPEGPGPAGLLAGDLAPLHDPGQGPPLLLASVRHRTPIAAVVAGVRMAVHRPGPHRAVTAMVHVDDLEILRRLAGHAHRVALHWDLADLPTRALDHVAEAVVTEAGTDVWAGLHLYSHPRRPLEDPTARHAAWRAVLDDYRGAPEAHA